MAFLIVCNLDAGCTTRDGTVQPKGTAFDRVATSDFPAPSECVLITDDGRPLYVQNSGGRSPATKIWPTYVNDTDAISHGLVAGDIYNSSSGLQQVGGGS